MKLEIKIGWFMKYLINLGETYMNHKLNIN